MTTREKKAWINTLGAMQDAAEGLANEMERFYEADNLSVMQEVDSYLLQLKQAVERIQVRDGPDS